MSPTVLVVCLLLVCLVFIPEGEASLYVSVCEGERERALPRGFQLSHCLNIPYF